MDNGIPPLVVYVAGLALIGGGLFRVIKLGRRHPEREVADDDPARSKARRWHFKFGILWMLMGIALIVMTAVTLRSKAPGTGRPDPSAAPVIRFDPAAPAPSAAPPAKQ